MFFDIGVVYDWEKGLNWGCIFKYSMVMKNGGSYGLVGGFGVGVV